MGVIATDRFLRSLLKGWAKSARDRERASELDTAGSSHPGYPSTKIHRCLGKPVSVAVRYFEVPLTSNSFEATFCSHISALLFACGIPSSHRCSAIPASRQIDLETNPCKIVLKKRPGSDVIEDPLDRHGTIFDVGAP